MKRSTLNLILVLSLIFVTYSHVVRADCTVNGTRGFDGTPGDDTINCSGPSTGPDDGVGGRGGDDTITVDAGSTVAVIGGDARGTPGGISTNDPTGTAGSDTIVVAGNVSSAVYGDYAGEVNNADDSITITSTGHVYSIIGDSVGATSYVIGTDHGDDTINIEAGGVVDASVDGDSDFMQGEAFTGGNDNITVNGSVGRNVNGQVGNDTITVGGTVDGRVDGGLDDDTINIETGGVVASNVDGDSVFMQEQAESGGNDNITVNGTVGGSVNGLVGNDTITIGGTVGGTVDGGLDDDQVILNDGANGGADNELAVNGGDGNDTLTFAFTISSQDDYDALAALIAGNSSSGSITINGQTITWSNFEQLINALIANFSVGTKVAFKDNRLNSTDAGASALAYCTGSGVQVLKVDAVTAQGSEAFTVTIAQIQAALAKAQSSNTNVEITTAAGVTLSATPDGKLVITAPDIGDVSKTYQFNFDAGVCGIS